MTDKDEVNKQNIKEMCENKIKFLCSQMANLIGVSQSKLQSSRCPNPMEISSENYDEIIFKKAVTNKTLSTEILKQDVHGFRNFVFDTGTKVVITAATALGYYIAWPIAIASGAATALGAQYSTNYFSDKLYKFVKQYGLVIYENITIDKKLNSADQPLYLEDMLSSNHLGRPKFKSIDIDVMINSMIKIREEHFKIGVGKNNCINEGTKLDEVVTVFPIYGVGTFEKNTEYDGEEYKKGMYVMFVAGVYNFFKIMEILLIRKYENSICQEYEHNYYEAMLRMKIQIIDICDKAFGNDVKTNSKPIKEIIKEEMDCAIDPEFSKSFKIDYCKKFQTSSGFLPGMPEWGWKAAVGVGVGAAALYGLKKWRDYKNAKTSLSSSSSSSSSTSLSSSPQPSRKTKKRGSTKGKKKSKRGSRRSRTETETSSKNKDKKKSTYKRSRR